MSFEKWEQNQWDLYYGPDCSCEDHCEGSGLEDDEDHTCCQCHEPEEYFNDDPDEPYDYYDDYYH
jgi:hypothetical protein